MSFSDWITITSILAAVLLGFFRYFEWEVIKRKQPLKFFWLPLICLFPSGIASYFNTNQHPAFLDWFWSFRIDQAFWPVIWLITFVISSVFCWRQFTDQAPSEGVIQIYNDLLQEKNNGLFYSLFFKYEGNFTKSTQYWNQYYQLLVQPMFWTGVPKRYERIVLANRDVIYTDFEFILKPFLLNQLHQLPYSSLGFELRDIEKTLAVSDDTPVLKLFLADSQKIERLRTLNVFLPVIKKFTEDYFGSAQYKSDIELLSEDSSWRDNPHNLLPIHVVNLISCYWFAVLRTHAQTSGFYFFSTMAERLLEKAPELEPGYNGDPTNAFGWIISRMLQTYRHISSIAEREATETYWMVEAMNNLEEDLRDVLREKFPTKVPRHYYETQED